MLRHSLFALYLDARSAFDKVMRQLLVEWDGIVMGPIDDQGGLEQGGVN